MKNSLGFCLMGLRVFSARGSRAPLLLDRGEALALARREATPLGPCWTVLRGLWN